MQLATNMSLYFLYLGRSTADPTPLDHWKGPLFMDIEGYLSWYSSTTKPERRRRRRIFTVLLSNEICPNQSLNSFLLIVFIPTYGLHLKPIAVAIWQIVRYQNCGRQENSRNFVAGTYLGTTVQGISPFKVYEDEVLILIIFFNFYQVS